MQDLTGSRNDQRILLTIKRIKIRCQYISTYVQRLQVCIRVAVFSRHGTWFGRHVVIDRYRKEQILSQNSCTGIGLIHLSSLAVGTFDIGHILMVTKLRRITGRDVKLHEIRRILPDIDIGIGNELTAADQCFYLIIPGKIIFCVKIGITAVTGQCQAQCNRIRARRGTDVIEVIKTRILTLKVIRIVITTCGTAALR